MPRYVAQVGLKRAYLGTVHRRLDEEGCQETLADAVSTMKADGVPSDNDKGWVRTGSTDVVSEDVTSDAKWLKAVLRTTVSFGKPMVVHAKNPKDAVRMATEACRTSRCDVPAEWPGNGWRLESQEVEVASVSPDAGGVRTSPRFDVSFAKAIAPDLHLCGLHTDEAFELFRWIVGATENYTETRSYYTHRAMMSINGSGGTSDRIEPIRSRQDLKARIASAILSQGDPLYHEWRRDHDVDPAGSIAIEAPTYGKRSCKARIHGDMRRMELFDVMEDAPGKMLAVHLNQFHADAVLVKNVTVAVSKNGFTLQLSYGIDDQPWSSGWVHELSSSRGGEPFVDTIERGIAALLELVPDWASQTKPRPNGMAKAA